MIMMCNIIYNFSKYIKETYDFYTINIKKRENDSIDANKIERVAEEERKNLGLSIDTPINSMTDEMERMGFLIIDSDFAVNEKIDSCFYDNQDNRVILNNCKKIDSVCRYRFSLAHELGHALFHCGEENEDKDSIEEEANYFASAFLLPRVAFLKEFDFLTKHNINWERLYINKKRWKVSMQAILRRAFNLDMIDRGKYAGALITMARNGERKKERGDDEIPFEEKKVLNAIKRDLDNEYYIVDNFIEKIGINLNLFNKIFNFNIKPAPKPDNIIVFRPR
jgi:Zn-dependent peptidase ImmA (M78 family)